METLDKIKKQIAENPILIYMKGTLQFINASDARAEKPQEGNFGEPFM